MATIRGSLKLGMLVFLLIASGCKTTGSQLAAGEGSGDVAACNNAKEAMRANMADGLMFLMQNVTDEQIGKVVLATGAAAYFKAESVDAFTGNPLDQSKLNDDHRKILSGEGGYNASGQVVASSGTFSLDTIQMEARKALAEVIAKDPKMFEQALNTLAAAYEGATDAKTIGLGLASDVLTKVAQQLKLSHAQLSVVRLLDISRDYANKSGGVKGSDLLSAVTSVVNKYGRSDKETRLHASYVIEQAAASALAVDPRIASQIRKMNDTLMKGAKDELLAAVIEGNIEVLDTAVRSGDVDEAVAAVNSIEQHMNELGMAEAAAASRRQRANARQAAQSKKPLANIGKFRQELRKIGQVKAPTPTNAIRARAR